MLIFIVVFLVVLTLVLTLVKSYDETSSTSESLRIISVDNDDNNNILVVKGYGFTGDYDNVKLSVGNKSCDNLEVCNVCQDCNERHCSHGSVCVMDKKGGNYCFIPCAGLTDNSCPCDTYCDNVRVHTISADSSSLLSLCTPRRFVLDDVCKDYSTEKIQCNPNKGALTTTSPNTYEIRLEVNSNTTIFSSLLSSSLSDCDTDIECHDGNICTVDKCQQGQCVQTYIVNENDCKKYTITNNKGRDVFFGYNSYINDNTDVHFSNYMVTHGKRLSTSWVDDFPTDRIKIPFSFQYFGNSINSININPNGVISLPPFIECHNVISSVASAECIVYSTETNTISAWGSDWDPSMFTDSNIYYYDQKKGDSSNLWGIDSNAFHVQYSHVAKYQVNKSEEAPRATFSVSVYSDSSIRINYQTTDAFINDTDVFGLWGSRASQAKSNLRYHEEKIPTSIIKNGSNVYYCSIDTVGCLDSSCVAPNDYIRLRWKLNSCAAVPDSSFYCDFGNGIATTIPIVSETDIECPVPVLPVVDGSIITFSIKMKSKSAQMVTEMVIRSIIAMNEYTQSQMTIKYSTMPQSCGCSSLFPDLKCDKSNVCGGSDDISDCYGTFLGVAYFDSCNNCRGGLTNREPLKSPSPMKCYIKSEFKLLMNEIISFSLLLFLFFFFSASLYVVFARMNTARQNLILRGMRLDETNREQTARGLNDKELTFIGEVSYTEGLFKDGLAECSICLGKFKDEPSSLRFLPPPCGHVFHQVCIDEWFKFHLQCPICKRNIRQIIEGGEGYEIQTETTRRPLRVSSQDIQAIQMLLNRMNNQTPAVNRGLVELRRMLSNRGGNNFSRIPDHEV